MAPQQDVCATCSTHASEDSKLLNCSRCKAVSYCNRGCQKADWKNHKKMCKPNSSPAVPHNMRDEAFPGFVEFGPVTTLGELRAMKPGDPPIKYDERLYEPTPKEVYERCIAIMDRNKGGDQQGQSSKDREQVSMSEGASKEQSE